MANIKTKLYKNKGVDFTKLPLAELADYDNATLKKTFAKLFDDDDNFTRFDGNNLKYKFVGGDLADVLGGTITSLKVETGGVRWLNITDVSLSAKQFFNFYLDNDVVGAVSLFLSGKDTITGTTKADVFFGGGNDDKLYGGGGKDTLSGDAGDDKLFGEAGDDTLNGGGGKDKLVGGDGNDTLNGGGGNDKLLAGGGNDTLNGGAGKDLLQGNAGADTFVFSAAGHSSSAARDTITDFDASEGDQIDLTALGVAAGDIGFSDSGTNTIVTVDVGGVDLVITLKDIEPAEISTSDFLL
ncbi:type I secretion C-terminal target domain-containing protein [Rhizobium sp. TRM95111]|uniref:calcium-binding protein n=1 Tax=Rhizobium alarense TaxID=2846851 RepID=UPI001F362182|nr:calcium-binding protein [Rhizobium alarense]MCF3643255.1 type I secretion C-terminal target domain-containing protein [Rhizobium alarense]